MFGIFSFSILLSFCRTFAPTLQNKMNEKYRVYNRETQKEIGTIEEPNLENENANE